MEKKNYDLNVKFVDLRNQVKGAICEIMKELECIKFNHLGRTSYSFISPDGEFVSPIIVELKYDTEYYDDVIAIDNCGVEWSVQEEGTVDGCMELLYYIESEEYEVIKE